MPRVHVTHSGTSKNWPKVTVVSERPGDSHNRIAVSTTTRGRIIVVSKMHPDACLSFTEEEFAGWLAAMAGLLNDHLERRLRT